jgi:hypothetical protein
MSSLNRTSSTLLSRLRRYVRATEPVLIALDVVRVVAIAATPFVMIAMLHWMAHQPLLVAPIHRRFITANAGHLPALLYKFMVWLGVATNVAWMMTAVRNFVAITLSRAAGADGARDRVNALYEHAGLPPYPYTRESFTIVLAELQDRDGTRVPNERSPKLVPRWLTLPELALYTGVFVTGGIGSGKTSAVAYPALKQLLGFRRPVQVRRRDGSIDEQEWKFSGLILDEKGDFTREASKFCELWQRSDDLIRLSPGGKWIWNVIYNPNLPAWAVGYQLGWIIKNFNKGQSGSDPFWENAPKELTTEYLGLLDDAEGYYTLFDYLEVLIDDARQDELNERAMARFAGDRQKTIEIERRWRAIQKRRNDMGANLRGSLEACARAGIDMFRQPELRRTFCPTREEYFEPDPATGQLRPRNNVFVGFDQALDYGKLVGLEMPKQIYFDAAVFCQVALKAQWQDSVLRRDTIGADGRPLMPPRFGEKIGYCPTFLMADEAQISATPRDGEFKAVCRSKRASMWELTQSHSSIKGSFGPSKQADAATYFQNSMTHIYLRQSDIESMKTIQEEVGKKLVQKTTLAVTEGGSASELSYSVGAIVHEGLGVSSTKTVTAEEKPFLEVEELKKLPNNVAVVLPSNGHRTLPATIAYLRPLFVYEKHRKLSIETSWFDWPQEERSTYDLDTIPQTSAWSGWRDREGQIGPLHEDNVIDVNQRLGRFVQAPLPPPPPKPATDETSNSDHVSSDDDVAEPASDSDEDVDSMFADVPTNL